MKAIIAAVIVVILLVLVAVTASKTDTVTLEEDCMNIVRLSYAAFNEGDWPSFADLHSPGYLHHAPDFKDPITWPDYELSCRIAHNRLPQLKYRIVDIFAVKDKVAVRSVWECPLDSSPYRYYFPDGIAKGSHICISLIKNGKIIEEWYEYDTVGIQRLISFAKSKEHMK